MEAREAPSWDRVSQWLETEAMRATTTKEKWEPGQGPHPEVVENARAAIASCVDADLPVPTYFSSTPRGEIVLGWAAAVPAAGSCVILVMTEPWRRCIYWVMNYNHAANVGDAMELLTRALRASGFV